MCDITVTGDLCLIKFTSALAKLKVCPFALLSSSLHTKVQLKLDATSIDIYSNGM